MSRPLLCDLCNGKVMEKFDMDGFQVKVWRKQHSYGGYNPWIRKTKLDICADCTQKIVTATLHTPPIKKDR